MLAHVSPDPGVEQQPGYGALALPGTEHEPGFSPNVGQLFIKGYVFKYQIFIKLFREQKVF